MKVNEKNQLVVSRTAFLAILKTAVPALSSNKNLVETLSYFWFDGEYVIAFDDKIGIKVGFKQNIFTGGVEGTKLLGLLENSHSRDIYLEVKEEGVLKVRATRTKVDFPLRSYEDWWWNPEFPEDKPYKVTDEFLKAISLLLISVGSGKVMNPEQQGITVVPNDKGYADFYSTDAVSLSWTRLKGTFATQRVVMLTVFCEQMKSLMSKGAEFCIEYDGENAGAYCQQVVEVFKKDSSEDDRINKLPVLLFGKLVEDENPEEHDFEVAIQNNPMGNTPAPVPPSLKSALDRALVFTNGSKSVVIGVGTVENKKKGIYYKVLFLEDNGDIRFDDPVKIEDTDHPDIATKIDPKLLRRGLDGRERMTVTDNAVILSGPGDFIHIVSTY